MDFHHKKAGRNCDRPFDSFIDLYKTIQDEFDLQLEDALLLLQNLLL